MEFDRQADGTLNPLPAPSIDTGMGLERITAVIQGKLSNYDTDLFTPLLDAIGEKVGRRYGASIGDPADISMRVIADHLRAMTFPHLRRRRPVQRMARLRAAQDHAPGDAARKKLGFTEPMLHTLVPVIVREMGDAYPQLLSDQDNIVRTVRSEEERFDAVLTAGLPRLEDAIDRAAAGARAIPGEEGLPPLRLAWHAAGLHGGRRRPAQRRHRPRGVRSRDAGAEGPRPRASSFKIGEKGLTITVPPEFESAFTGGAEEFTGYDATLLTGVPVMGVFDDKGGWIDKLAKARRATSRCRARPSTSSPAARSPTRGGCSAPTARKRSCSGWCAMHRAGRGCTTCAWQAACCRAIRSSRAGAGRAARRDPAATTPATHLLHAALRQVLGSHVKQAGSLVAPDRLRFDFVHFAAIPRADCSRSSGSSTSRFAATAAVQTEVRSTEEAIAAGAMALFGEKYGDRVRVVSVPGFSLELCGGTHVKATGDIGYFVITEESGVAAGVRRIEAWTGAKAVERAQQQRCAIESVQALLNVPGEQAAEACASGCRPS
jgi:alanyl-tRNA synthetase